VSEATVNPVPPGWYPDPSGERQWRVWTGTTWSEVTRPYGEPVEAPRLDDNFELLLALRRVFGAGIIGVVGGFGFLVGVLAHWPGTAHPEPRWFALTASNAAVALLLVGSVICAFAVRELRGRWTLDAFLPGLNLFVASVLVAQRLGQRRSWRVLTEIGLLALFAASSRADPWLFVGPMVVAFVESSWFGALIDRLSGSAKVPNPVAP
jgi:Protein of unknown function (DUF2510)